MNTNLTEITCVIDRSGSMERVRTDAMGGYNSFIDQQQQEPGEARVTLVLFNHDYEMVEEGAPLPQARRLDEATYVPAGTTALLDAVGRAVDSVGERLAQTPEEERPGHVIVAILTDGLENASSDYTRERILEMIRHQQETYDWEFIFLAANQDAFAEAGRLGIGKDDAMAFAASPAGVKEAYASLSSDVSARRARRRQRGEGEKT